MAIGRHDQAIGRDVHDCDQHFFDYVVFLPGSAEPRQPELDEAVEYAFTDPDRRNAYIARMQQTLGTTNPFRDITRVKFAWSPTMQSVENPTEPASTVSTPQEPVDQIDTASAQGGSGGGSSSQNTGAAAGAGAAGAGIFVVLLGAFFISRRGHMEDDEEAMGKFIDEADGHVTVAGETFAGETHGSSVGEDQQQQLQQQKQLLERLQEQQQAGLSPPATSSEESSGAMGASNWDDFQRNLNEDSEPGLAPSDWDDMHEALSAGRPPSPTAWGTSMLSNVVEEENEDEFSYSEESAVSEQGPLEDVNL